MSASRPSRRKPISNVRPSKKFFVVASPPGVAGNTRYIFLSSLRFTEHNPTLAKRLYSLKAAEKFLKDADTNPYMKFRVYRMLETRDGLSIGAIPEHVSNPSRKKRRRK
jgi:hypothetical protein